MRILLIEDDRAAAEVVAQGLTESGHQVVIQACGRDGLALAEAGAFDVVVLDRMLPDMDGMDVLARYRDNGGTLPVVLVSALGEVDQRVEGLRGGADDYLAKPFVLTELLARIEAVVRRHDAQAETVLRVADLEVDLIERTVCRGGVMITLQPREFRLLEFLMRRAGQVVTRSMLLEGVWRYRFAPETKVIDVQVSRLRQKIDKDFGTPLIHTIRGIGYRIGVLG
jgi:two-component system OmpR family response regulator